MGAALGPWGLWRPCGRWRPWGSGALGALRALGALGAPGAQGRGEGCPDCSGGCPNGSKRVKFIR